MRGREGGAVGKEAIGWKKGGKAWWGRGVAARRVSVLAYLDDPRRGTVVLDVAWWGEVLCLVALCCGCVGEAEIS